jgi:hypothetical protein
MSDRGCWADEFGDRSWSYCRWLLPEVVMANVFVHTMMSLDGFIAGPNDDMS